MGCANSKRIDDVVTDIYRPPPSSFAIFDIHSIEEPWLKSTVDGNQQSDEKPNRLPDPLLEKLNAIEDAPRTWQEISKALEDLKPTLTTPTPTPPPAPKTNPPAQDSKGSPDKSIIRKNASFHTLEELDVKVTESKKSDSVAKTDLKKFQANKVEPQSAVIQPIPEVASGGGYKPVKQNIFIVKDRLEREKEGKSAPIVKRDPLSDYPEICPPGGAESVVIYTTSLGGVRRTFEGCNRLRSILEYHRVVFDERDVSLHSGFLHELRELLGDSAHVPRVFVKGRYIGGEEEVVGLNETGRLGRILNWARVERGAGRLGCEGCGGARFVPCWDCGGSCKVVVEGEKQRCSSCNENGLVECPACV